MVVNFYLFVCCTCIYRISSYQKYVIRIMIRMVQFTSQMTPWMQVCVALLYVMLTDQSQASKAWRDLTIVSRDNLQLVLARLNQLVSLRFLDFQDSAVKIVNYRIQTLWIICLYFVGIAIAYDTWISQVWEAPYARQNAAYLDSRADYHQVNHGCYFHVNIFTLPCFFHHNWVIYPRFTIQLFDDLLNWISAN